MSLAAGATRPFCQEPDERLPLGVQKEVDVGTSSVFAPKHRLARELEERRRKKKLDTLRYLGRSAPRLRLHHTNILLYYLP